MSQPLESSISRFIDSISTRKDQQGRYLYAFRYADDENSSELDDGRFSLFVSLHFAHMFVHIEIHIQPCVV